jgi:hypothetical protein
LQSFELSVGRKFSGDGIEIIVHVIFLDQGVDAKGSSRRGNWNGIILNPSVVGCDRPGNEDRHDRLSTATEEPFEEAKGHNSSIRLSQDAESEGLTVAKHRPGHTPTDSGGKVCVDCDHRQDEHYQDDAGMRDAAVNGSHARFKPARPSPAQHAGHEDPYEEIGEALHCVESIALGHVP